MSAWQISVRSAVLLLKPLLRRHMAMSGAAVAQHQLRRLLGGAESA